MSKSLYQELKAIGAQMDSHESDLYVKADEAAMAVLERWNHGGKPFRSKLDGKIWYDVPFAYEPWWEKRGIR